ncbi:MAG: hypothetical protein OXC05_08555 [Halieaceae bacterium]|nr:hypothetical protein [Halieaceae bacterium]
MSLTRRSFVTGLCMMSFVPLGFSETAYAVSSDPISQGALKKTELEDRTFYSGDCSPLGTGGEVSFNMKSGRVMLADSRCHMILHHDYMLRADNWIYIPVTRQALPIFVNAERTIQALTLEALTKIIYGQVTDWEEIGGAPGRIRVTIRRSSPLNYFARKMEVDRFNHILFRGGIDPTRVRKDVYFVEKYEQLADLAKMEKDVLAFGLRGVPFNGLRMLRVDGVPPMDVEAYPLSTSIRLATRSSGRGFSLMTEYLKRAQRRFNQDRQILDAYLME